MPTPTPAEIIANPDPLNPSGFPFEVVAFPAETLLQDGGFDVPKVTKVPVATDAPNFEPGQQ